MFSFLKVIFAFFGPEVNKPSPHLVTVLEVKAMDSRVLPFLRASVACIFKMLRDLNVARYLGHAPF